LAFSASLFAEEPRLQILLMSKNKPFGAQGSVKIPILKMQ